MNNGTSEAPATARNPRATTDELDTLKRELIHRRSFQTSTEAQSAIFEYIEAFYNRKRIHSSLNYLSPEAFEAQIN